MILAVINQKGGVGKTTTAMHLARLWADLQPVVLDVDPQNATRFYSIEGANIGAVADADVPRWARLATGRPVLIDCPPSLAEAKHSIAAATHVLVPCSCEALAVPATDGFLEAFRNVYPDKPVRVLATRFRSSSDSSRRQLQTLKHEFDGRICLAVIPASPHFETTAEQGLTVFDAVPNSTAARQYRRVAQELQTWQQQTD